MKKLKLRKIKHFNCVCCGKILERAWPKSNNDKWKTIAVTDGVGIDTYVGYGSKFDCERIFIAVCDECLEKSIEKGDTHIIDTFLL